MTELAELQMTSLDARAHHRAGAALCLKATMGSIASQQPKRLLAIWRVNTTSGLKQLHRQQQESFREDNNALLDRLVEFDSVRAEKHKLEEQMQQLQESQQQVY